jgi:hypothetical protein
MNEAPDNGFDFEVWATLARDDPDEFERRRQAEIRKVIDARPDLKHRLEGLQFRIDAERTLARTPLKSCLRISEMMWNSFYELKDGLDDLAGATQSDAPVAPSSPPRAADVIPLRTPAPSADNSQ